MKVLLIEDDEFKQRSIELALRACRPDFLITSADSLYTATAALEDGPFDLIVLDMAIPSHPPMPGQGAPVSFLTGGLDILLELEARGRVDPCIIITQFPEIEISEHFYSVDRAARAIRDNLGYNVIECVAYSSDSDTWLEHFTELLNCNGYSCS